MPEHIPLLARDVSFGRVGLAQVSVLMKNLSVMLRSGIPILEALTIAGDATTGTLKHVLQRVERAVESGRPLSEALREHPRVFSGLVVNAVFTGEKAGRLPENLETLADELEKDRALIAKVRGALVYPSIVVAGALALGLGVSLFVLPKITPLFEGLAIDLPWATRRLIDFSKFVQRSGTTLVMSLFGAAAFLYWVTRQHFSKPLTHALLLRLPIVGRLVRQANLARFCRSLSVLLKSGVNIDEAIVICQGTLGNYYYGRALALVARRVQTGDPLSAGLNDHAALFPLLATRMIAVGEQSGQLEETLLYLATYYEVEVDNSTKSLSTAIEPALLICIGLVVAFLALSIITPIYSITGNVQR